MQLNIRSSASSDVQNGHFRSAFGTFLARCLRCRVFRPGSYNEFMSGQPAAPKPSRRRRLLRVALGAFILYLSLVIGLTALQNKLIFPGTFTQGTIRAVVDEWPGTKKIVRLQLPDGTPIVAQFIRADAPDPETAPTVLFFYGNAMCAAHASDIIWMFRELGCNVMCADYPGYGMSGGEPSEQAFYAAADAAYAHLMHRKDIAPDRIVPVGLSIGCGVATDMAARKKVAGLVLFASFTSLHDMGRYAAPWLPTSLMLRYRFDNLEKIAQIETPIFICHGEADTTIPPAMSRKLIDNAGGPVTSLFIPGAAHNNLLHLGRRPIERELRAFLDAFE